MEVSTEIIPNWILYGLLGIAIFIIIQLLIREIRTWYWKINDIVENQEKTNQLLSEIAEKLNKEPNEKRPE